MDGLENVKFPDVKLGDVKDCKLSRRLVKANTEGYMGGIIDRWAI